MILVFYLIFRYNDLEIAPFFNYSYSGEFSMSVVVTLTGSFPPVRLSPPPLTNDEVVLSIQQCVEAQLKATSGKNIDWLFVSGQPQNDIVGIFATGLGLQGSGLPYKIDKNVKHESPITLDELRITANFLGKKPLKAHITDPVLMAECCTVDSYLQKYRSLDEASISFAHALAEEVEMILSNDSLPITHIQIDAPSLTSGEDLPLAQKTIEIVLSSVPSNIQTILHVCHDTGKIMGKLLDMEKINILSVELQHLNDIAWLDAKVLSNSEKKLALGVMPVNTNDIPSARLIERDLIFAAEKYDIKNIWGITPNCGLRLNTLAEAQERLLRLADVAEKLNSRFATS